MSTSSPGGERPLNMFLEASRLLPNTTPQPAWTPTSLLYIHRGSPMLSIQSSHSLKNSTLYVLMLFVGFSLAFNTISSIMMIGKLKTLGLQYHKQTTDSSDWQLQLLDLDTEHKAWLIVDFRKRSQTYTTVSRWNWGVVLDFWLSHLSVLTEKEQKQLYFLMNFNKEKLPRQVFNVCSETIEGKTWLETSPSGMFRGQLKRLVFKSTYGQIYWATVIVVSWHVVAQKTEKEKKNNPPFQIQLSIHHVEEKL